MCRVSHPLPSEEVGKGKEKKVFIEETERFVFDVK
jgi:hypothetical protein